MQLVVRADHVDVFGSGYDALVWVERICLWIGDVNKRGSLCPDELADAGHNPNFKGPYHSCAMRSRRPHHGAGRASSHLE